MPFVDIRCNNMTLQSVSGIQLATGFEVKGPGSDRGLIDELKGLDQKDVKIDAESGKKEPNAYALAALILGLLSFALSMTMNQNLIRGAILGGGLAVLALIATMVDIKRKLKIDLADIGERSTWLNGRHKLGDDLYISVDFTVGFYIAILAFVAGTWFSIKRIKAT
jgi:hypothetical protein